MARKIEMAREVDVDREKEMRETEIVQGSQRLR
jgi:hypothetical protein